MDIKLVNGNIEIDSKTYHILLAISERLDEIECDAKCKTCDFDVNGICGIYAIREIVNKMTEQ